MCVIIKRDELPYNLERKKKKKLFWRKLFLFSPDLFGHQGRKQKGKEERRETYTVL